MQSLNQVLLSQAIAKANKQMTSWSEEDLKNYAFDRLVNELLKKLHQEQKV